MFAYVRCFFWIADVDTCALARVADFVCDAVHTFVACNTATVMLGFVPFLRFTISTLLSLTIWFRLGLSLPHNSIKLTRDIILHISARTFMDPRDLLLIEFLDDVVACHSPEPDECCGCCGDEEGWKENYECEADTNYDEEDGAQEAKDESGYEGEDGDGDGHDDEEAEWEAGEGDVGGEKGLVAC